MNELLIQFRVVTELKYGSLSTRRSQIKFPVTELPAIRHHHCGSSVHSGNRSQ